MKGDNLGTPAESAVKATWPDYNAQYLKEKLVKKQRRFDTTTLVDQQSLDDIEKQVYLQETLKGYEGEAEACLKAEFDQWLQGHHEENNLAEKGKGFYVNNDGVGEGPKRRHVFEGEVSTEMADNKGGGLGHTGWQATRWGTKPLTHLAGVRDYLREGKIRQDNAERDMNLLAERGPQDLDEAWMYFKHWVKKRPVVTCADKGVHNNAFDLHNTRHLEHNRMNGIGPSNWMSRDDSSRNEGRAAPAPQARQPDVNNDGFGIGGGDPSAENWYNDDEYELKPREIDFSRADAATSAAAEAMAELGEPPQWEEARRATRSDTMQEDAPSTLQMRAFPHHLPRCLFRGRV